MIVGHSAVALLLKAALIQMSDYRLLGASGWWRKPENQEKTTDLSHVNDKLYHIMLYQVQCTTRLPDTILEKNHPMTIPSKFGSN
jgi:hypothetical protein